MSQECGFNERVLELLHALVQQNQSIEGKLEKIMADEQAALALLATINTLTNKEAAVLQSDADVTQKISDNVDKLIAAAQAVGVPQSIMDGLNALATQTQAASDQGDKHAKFLTDLANKAAGATPANPAPTPVPAPLPAPAALRGL